MSLIFLDSEKIAQAIEATRATGAFFSVAAVRRTARRKNDARGPAEIGDIALHRRARLGVKKHLKTKNGEGKKYNFAEKNLVCVFVFPDKAQDDPADPDYEGSYRAVPRDTMVFARVDGNTLVSPEGLAYLLEKSGTVEKAEERIIGALQANDDDPAGFIVRSKQGIEQLRKILKESAISV